MAEPWSLPFNLHPRSCLRGRRNVVRAAGKEGATWLKRLGLTPVPGYKPLLDSRQRAAKSSTGQQQFFHGAVLRNPRGGRASSGSKHGTQIGLQDPGTLRCGEAMHGGAQTQPGQGPERVSGVLGEREAARAEEAPGMGQPPGPKGSRHPNGCPAAARPGARV